MNRDAKGLTLLEVVLALAVLGLLSVSFGGFLGQAMRDANREAMSTDVGPLGEWADQLVAEPEECGWSEFPESSQVTLEQEDGTQAQVVIQALWSHSVEEPGGWGELLEQEEHEKAQPRVGWCVVEHAGSQVLRRIEVVVDPRAKDGVR